MALFEEPLKDWDNKRPVHCDGCGYSFSTATEFFDHKHQYVAHEDPKRDEKAAKAVDDAWEKRTG